MVIGVDLSLDLRDRQNNRDYCLTFIDMKYLNPPWTNLTTQLHRLLTERCKSCQGKALETL